MKPLIVGQAPGPSTDPDVPLSGRCGARLAAFCGLEVADFLRRFDRVNLVSEFPGKAGKGDLFPIDEARAAALRLFLFGDVAGRLVVLLGDNVAAAFMLPRGLKPLRWIPGLAIRAAVCPHPSGVNRWWNDPNNVAKARRFWRKITAEINDA